MIVKQYHEVIAGDKIQTRRMKDRYQVGRVYSVVPKMYQKTVMYGYDGVGDVFIWDATKQQPVQEWYKLKVRITDKRMEPLQNLTNDDALAEGINVIHGFGDSFYFSHKLTEKCFDSPVEAYQDLWNAINDKKGLRWEDNPQVVVYTFEVVK